MTTGCKCGEGCEEYSCFIGYNCQCCIETYGARLLCDCHECRMERIRNKELRSAPDGGAGPPSPVDAREAD